MNRIRSGSAAETGQRKNCKTIDRSIRKAREWKTGAVFHSLACFLCETMVLQTHQDIMVYKISSDDAVDAVSGSISEAVTSSISAESVAAVLLEAADAPDLSSWLMACSS